MWLLPLIALHLVCSAAVTIPEIIGAASGAADIPPGVFLGHANCNTTVDKPLAIVGAGSAVSMVDCSGTGLRVLRVVGVAVSIRGLTLRGGSEGYVVLGRVADQVQAPRRYHLGLALLCGSIARTCRRAGLQESLLRAAGLLQKSRLRCGSHGWVSSSSRAVTKGSLKDCLRW